MRLKTVIGLALAALLVTSVVANAHFTIKIGSRPGGNVASHLMIARQWHTLGIGVRLTGSQYSAAAMQVILFKKLGGDVCARKGIRLYLHQPTLFGHRIPDYRRFLKQMMGGIDLGPLPLRTWKIVDPKKYGIRTCKV